LICYKLDPTFALPSFLRAIKETEDMPDSFVEEVLDFILFLKMKLPGEKQEALILSESSLAKEGLVKSRGG